MARTKQTARAVSPEVIDENAEPEKPFKVEEMKMEIKHLEDRYTREGYRKIDEVGALPPSKDKVDRWRDYLLCLVRHFDRTGMYSHSTLDIKSPLIKNILMDVIGEYPGQSFKIKDIVLPLPCKAIYHYFDELDQKKDSLDPESLDRKHLEVFLDYMKEDFSEVISETKNLGPQGLISYKLLWTLFKPGCEVHAKINGHHRVFLCSSTDYSCSQFPGLALNCTSIGYDGKKFGWQPTSLFIPAFGGTMNISGLPSCPLDLHPQKELIKRRVTARGKKYESLRGKQHQYYSGLTAPESGVKTYNINGPIMVDCETFNRMNTDRACIVVALKTSDGDDPEWDAKKYSDDYSSSDDNMHMEDVEQQTDDEFVPLDDDQLLLCSPAVRGFAFAEKKWCQFYVDAVGPPRWNDNAFDQLVLPARQKSLVKALVEAHVTDAGGGFDDFIKGKGKGLIAILHGPPGVGKTLTAEAVSHVTHRPLYMISSGELGTDAQQLEHKLSQILDVASVWKVILLLDEADVFLEKRSTHDLNRNALVSIFLRLLEYYEGILMLTTNRVTTFDEAFQSRIHVALKYNNLTKEARKSVWKNFLAKMDNADIDEAAYETLSEYVYNGRQIKNCVRTAKILADRERQPLKLDQVETVLQIQHDFEQDLGVAF